MQKRVVRYQRDIHVQRNEFDKTYNRYNTTSTSWNRLNVLLNSHRPEELLDFGRYVAVGEVYVFPPPTRALAWQFGT